MKTKFKPSANLIKKLQGMGIDEQTVDFGSYSGDIPMDEWLEKEYNIVLTDKKEEIDNNVFQHKEADEYYKNYVHSMDWNIFFKPSVIGIVSNPNEGKSNLIYYFIKELQKKYKISMYSYGLKYQLPKVTPIHSVEELEVCRNSIIWLDELFSLWNLDDRKQKQMIENTLRLIYNNNNVLVLSALAENYKKFLSAKLDVVIFKKVSLQDLINGSRVKNIIMNYKGMERGTVILELPVDEAIVYDYQHYRKINIPYLRRFDSKLKNVPICMPKLKRPRKRAKSVHKNVLKTCKKRS